VTINQELEARILRYHHVEQWGVHTIAAQLGVHHSVVDRVLSQAGMPKVERAARASMIDPYLPFIVEELAEFPRLSAARLFHMARVRGYTGAESHFRSRIAQLRPRAIPEAYLRLKTLPGEQGQVDWGLCRARHRPHYAERRAMPSGKHVPMGDALRLESARHSVAPPQPFPSGGDPWKIHQKNDFGACEPCQPVHSRRTWTCSPVCCSNKATSGT